MMYIYDYTILFDRYRKEGVMGLFAKVRETFNNFL